MSQTPQQLSGASPTTGMAGDAAGLFLTFEGVDGAGKSTQCDLVCRALRAGGRTVVKLREPGGTRLGERIRDLLLDPAALDDGATMSPVAEMLLYEAARAQLVSQVVLPALARGDVVVSDRFGDSTVAYQGFARHLGADVARALNGVACGDVVPTRTLMLDMDPDAAPRPPRAAPGRAPPPPPAPGGGGPPRGGGGAGPDRVEAEGGGFQRVVRAGMLDCAAGEPGRVHVIDASGTVDDVYERVRRDLSDIVVLPCLDRIEGGVRP